MRARLSYANVTSTIALVLALGGSAVAASYVITSTNQIKPSVLKKLKGRKGPAGPAGSPGVPGAAGVAGAKGDKGEAGATGQAGPAGQTGATGTPDTSNFFNKTESDSRYLGAVLASPGTATGLISKSWVYGAAGNATSDGFNDGAGSDNSLRATYRSAAQNTFTHMLYIGGPQGQFTGQCNASYVPTLHISAGGGRAVQASVAVIAATDPTTSPVPGSFGYVNVPGATEQQIATAAAGQSRMFIVQVTGVSAFYTTSAAGAVGTYAVTLASLGSRCEFTIQGIGQVTASS